MTAGPVSPSMSMMIRASWKDCDPRGARLDGDGYGVELIGAGAWRVARKLVDQELGTIEGGRPNGSELCGLFFANRDAADLLGLFDDEDDGLEFGKDWEE